MLADLHEADSAVRGEVPYLDALRKIHRLLDPTLYLEIGVNRGHSLRLAKCRAIGVDPAYRIDRFLPARVTFIQSTSDAFFAGGCAEALAGVAPDLIFIDGLHLFENALRDFINAERIAAPHALIVLDDIIPNHPAQASRERHTRVWTGDVWKLHDILREHRPDLTLLALDTQPTGMLAVSGLKPSSLALSKSYDAIVDAYGQIAEPPPRALSRESAASPKGPELKRLIQRMKQVREGAASPDILSKPLRSVRHGGPPL